MLGNDGRWHHVRATVGTGPPIFTAVGPVPARNLHHSSWVGVVPPRSRNWRLHTRRLYSDTAFTVGVTPVRILTVWRSTALSRTARRTIMPGGDDEAVRPEPARIVPDRPSNRPSDRESVQGS